MLTLVSTHEQPTREICKPRNNFIAVDITTTAARHLPSETFSLRKAQRNLSTGNGEATKLSSQNTTLPETTQPAYTDNNIQLLIVASNPALGFSTVEDGDNKQR